MKLIYLKNCIYLYPHRGDRFCKNPENQASETVTSSDIIADSHTDINSEKTIIQSAEGALYGKNNNYNN